MSSSAAPAPPAEASPPWHALPAAEALEGLGSTSAGLDAAEAGARALRFGPNVLRPPPPVSALRVLGNQLHGVVPLLFTAAGAVSLGIGDQLEAAAIGAVLALNVIFGFLTEWRAHRAMNALRHMQVREAVVRRDGRDRRIDAAGLVPGDLMVLEAGTAVAADGRLIAAAELRLIEAPLTGESFPAEKKEAAVPAAAALAERTSMVYKGTLVAAGSGLALVTATGPHTEIGKIGELVESLETGSGPLERRIEKLGRFLVAATLGIAAVAATVGIARGGAPAEMIQLALALAIAAVPEGLPVVVTVVLAIGLHRMARERALVRRLHAVEALGSSTVLCTDKTGTLTAGEMTVVRLLVGGATLEVEGRGYSETGGFRLDGRPVEPGEVPGLLPALAAGALANRARLGPAGGAADGDPTELALLVAAGKAGLVRGELEAATPEVGELPFDSRRMWMATFHRRGESLEVAAKGAPARLLDLCGAWLSPTGEKPLTAAAKAALLAENDRLAAEGLRVLGLAAGALPPGTAPVAEAVGGLTFLGMAAIEDPEVGGVADTVRELQSAGLRVVMLTGDQVLTAAAVARRLGILLPGDEVASGAELRDLDPAALAAKLGRTAVLGRLEPGDKLRIVEALQHGGETVAMIGDGINDGPALRRADVGVALGLRGTDVAKETAAMVLADDRLPTVLAAVREGRATRDNIEKALVYLFTCNLAEVLVLAVAFASGEAPALRPLQVLWLNLATDVFPALGLAMEPAEPDLLKRGPRPAGGRLLAKGRGRRIVAGAVALAVANLAAFAWGRRLGLGPAQAGTLAFLTLGGGQLFAAWDARSESRLLFSRRFWQNGWLWVALAVSVALLLLVVYTPALAPIFGAAPPPAKALLVSLAAALAPYLVAQLSRTERPSRPREVA